MTLSQVATAECPRCHTVAELSRFARHYGDRAGIAIVECSCGCGGKWRRVEVGK